MITNEKDNLKPVSIYLEKRVPYKAGLGSGSSNAGFTLKFLNSFWNLNLSREDLFNIAEKIGSDVDFFIENKPSIVEEKGKVTKILPYIPLNIIILKPKNSHIDTKTAYKKLAEKKLYSNDLLRQKRFISAYLENNIEKMCENMFNSFEQIVNNSSIIKAKDLLYESGALKAMLSGSGSAVFAVYKNKQDYENAIEFLKNKKIKSHFDFLF